jgi:hypothetical protein
MDIHKSINNTRPLRNIRNQSKLKVSMLKRKIKSKEILIKSLSHKARKIMIQKLKIQIEGIQHLDSFRLYLKKDRSQEGMGEEIQDLVHYKK